MKDKQAAEEWCPTMSGTYTAYEPEWLDGDKWREVPVTREPYGQQHYGVPQPLCCGGVNATVGLYGHEQAQALAWGFAAQAVALGKEIKVRVQPYEVVYDIKARKK